MSARDHGTPPDGPAPAGARPAERRAGPLLWVDPGALPLSAGDRVVLADEAGTPWLADVVVAPDQVVEWPELGPLPPVIRRATDEDAHPPLARRAGALLAQSLNLPAGRLASAKRRSADAAVRHSARPQPAALPNQERADQQQDGEGAAQE